jgi:hypothetical protein
MPQQTLGAPEHAAISQMLSDEALHKSLIDFLRFPDSYPESKLVQLAHQPQNALPGGSSEPSPVKALGKTAYVLGKRLAPQRLQSPL